LDRSPRRMIRCSSLIRVAQRSGVSLAYPARTGDPRFGHISECEFGPGMETFWSSSPWAPWLRRLSIKTHGRRS
jgi:hypothetical protein